MVNVLIPFLLTTVAGLSTGIGSAIPFFFKSFKKAYLAFFLGLSAGVMILVSFVELLPNAIDAYEGALLWPIVAFFVGIAAVILIDFMIPHQKNPHHMPREDDSIKEIQKECQGECEDPEEIVESRVLNSEEGKNEQDEDKTLIRAGIITAIAIAIHNFPEGIATFAAALDDLSVGIAISIAIAIHNIPEGISVSIPIYYATKNKWKSFGLSLASGIAEIVGAVIAYLILLPFLAKTRLVSLSLAFVAGIMVYISIDELIPIAREYGKGDIVMAGLVVGMIIMAGSLVLFQLF